MRHHAYVNVTASSCAEVRVRVHLKAGFFFRMHGLQIFRDCWTWCAVLMKITLEDRLEDSIDEPTLKQVFRRF